MVYKQFFTKIKNTAFLFEEIKEPNYHKAAFAKTLLMRIDFYKKIAPLDILDSQKGYLNNLEERCNEVFKK